MIIITSCCHSYTIFWSLHWILKGIYYINNSWGVTTDMTDECIQSRLSYILCSDHVRTTVKLGFHIRRAPLCFSLPVPKLWSKWLCYQKIWAKWFSTNSFILPSSPESKICWAWNVADDEKSTRAFIWYNSKSQFLWRSGHHTTLKDDNHDSDVSVIPSSVSSHVQI